MVTRTAAAIVCRLLYVIFNDMLDKKASKNLDQGVPQLPVIETVTSPASKLPTSTTNCFGSPNERRFICLFIAS